MQQAKSKRTKKGPRPLCGAIFTKPKGSKRWKRSA